METGENRGENVTVTKHGFEDRRRFALSARRPLDKSSSAHSCHVFGEGTLLLARGSNREVAFLLPRSR